MKSAKNPGLGARMGSVEAALAARTRGKQEPESPKAEDLIITSVRLPRPMHNALRAIVYEEGNRGNKVSIHSLILEGVEKVIKQRK
jgi:hypothetical protein